jgi:hypothetical protein
MNRAQERKILHHMMIRYAFAAIAIYIGVFFCFLALKWIVTRFVSAGAYAELIYYVFALLADLWLSKRIMYTKPVNDFVKRAFGPDID